MILIFLQLILIIKLYILLLIKNFFNKFVKYNPINTTIIFLLKILNNLDIFSNISFLIKLFSNSKNNIFLFVIRFFFLQKLNISFQTV
ncbi:MAG: hypothetical protein ACM66E_00275 [Enterobacteriaceae bacterium]